MRSIRTGTAAVSFVLLSIAPLNAASAAAESTSTSSIDWTPIVVALINLIVPLVGGIATYLINKRLKDRQLADLLANAVTNSLGIVRAKALGAATSTRITTDAGGSPEIRAGIQYVIDNAAEAISRYKISSEQIGQKIEARLGLAEIATNLAATASPAPIVAGPLAPTPTIAQAV